MDIFVNNPPAQNMQTFPVQGYGAPAYGYGPQYGPPHGGGFGFVLLALLGAAFFVRWNRFSGRRRRWAMQGGYGPAAQQGGPQAQEGRDWKPPRMPWMRDGAAEIARERFARGEINADELAAILKGLDAEEGR